MKSLLAKYMLLIFIAILLVQLAYLLVGSLAIFGFNIIDKEVGDTQLIEKKWHEDVEGLQTVNQDTMQRLFQEWKEDYPRAGMFWVNGDGELVLEEDTLQELPQKWGSVDTLTFNKNRYDSDPFTVIAFPPYKEKNGFVVFELPRSEFDPPILKASERYGYLILIGVFLLIAFFIMMSFMFFRKIQKRLVKLEDAMKIRDEDGLPIEVTTKKEDEIGQLEKSFNRMVHELRDSRKREQEEEQIRRELIANLSHDLRTPLTKVRAQSYTISKENLTPEGHKAIEAIETSIENIDRLIENLMSYTLLMASKYKYDPRPMDITRFLRESVAAWYPVFEKENYEIEIELVQLGEWNIDPMWMERILDNLFQNVIRHAGIGSYIAIKTKTTEKYDAILIIDKGPGIHHDTSEKGAGIGLTIVNMMVKGMGLEWDMDSNETGTTITIKKMK
ncbi:HAMP domain-containing sensor histidine kinase [Ornithinibacillus scapharcae]|uniref:HAMP domain-containing sensor histidine kinase n=1 Tax=Ornithinibacillus scapharcae TaxID=1147159 RepID=UPI001ED8FA92|nr:HAMP domain-containing sensor histidine kinase [Ornithinibacillus scapharcae]